MLTCVYTINSYPVYVNIWNRDTMDTHRDTNVGVEPTNEKEPQLEKQTTQVEHIQAEVE